MLQVCCRNRLLFEAEELQAFGQEAEGGQLLVLPASDSRTQHVRQVLKAAPGEQLRIGQLNGPKAEARVAETLPRNAPSGALALHVERWERTPVALPRTDLLLAMPRPKVMRRLWAQLAALGVGHVVLTGAERVEHSYFSSHVLEEQVLKRELWRGLEQCGETLLPHVHLGSTRSLQRTLRALQPQEQQPAPRRLLAGAEVGQGWQLRAAASMWEGEGCRLVAPPSPSEHEGAAVPAVASSGRRRLAIGPEGGWRAAELELLRQHNFATFSLGSRVLTTETATVALLSGLKSLANDW